MERTLLPSATNSFQSYTGVLPRALAEDGTDPPHTTIAASLGRRSRKVRYLSSCFWSSTKMTFACRAGGEEQSGW